MGNTAAALKPPTPASPTEKARGSLSFKIIDYELHKGLGAGRFIRSASVRVGGYSWCLCYFPDGLNGKKAPDGGGFVSICLELLTRNVGEVRLACDIRLVDQETKSSTTIARTETRRGPSESAWWGGSPSRYAMAILEANDLEDSAYLHDDDSLLFECDITVFKGPSEVLANRKAAVVKKASPQQPPPRNSLTHDLAMLLESRDDADVVFHVQGEAFPAHTTVLAMRSPVFKAQFHGPMAQQQKRFGASGHDQRHVTIEDMQPEIFRALLHFIYTDSLMTYTKGLSKDERRQLMMHLLVAADRYDVEKLRFDCETWLCGSVDVENAATMLDLAERHSCSVLKRACVEFIVCTDNMDGVAASEDYSRLKESCPDVLEGLSPVSARENRLLDFLKLFY